MSPYFAAVCSDVSPICLLNKAITTLLLKAKTVAHSNQYLHTLLQSSNLIARGDVRPSPDKHFHHFERLSRHCSEQRGGTSLHTHKHTDTQTHRHTDTQTHHETRKISRRKPFHLESSFCSALSTSTFPLLQARTAGLTCPMFAPLAIRADAISPQLLPAVSMSIDSPLWCTKNPPKSRQSQPHMPPEGGI